MKFKAAFDSFMAENFEDAVIKATEASWSGGGYSVELFEDGHYRVLWNGRIGNMYDSPGLILGIPSLGADEWDDNDPDMHFYENAEYLLVASFEEVMASEMIEVA